MKITIRGDKLEVTKAIKEYVNEKIGKLDKYFDKTNEPKCSVLIKVKNEIQRVEVTIPTSKFTIRAEEQNRDLYAAIDLIIDKLERLIRKNKTKLENRYHSVKNFEMTFDYESDEEAEDIKFARRKDIETKPMDEEEAMLQMQLLNHDFFAFKNMDEECVSVIYKRKDGSFGILNIK